MCGWTTPWGPARLVNPTPCSFACQSLALSHLCRAGLDTWPGRCGRREASGRDLATMSISCGGLGDVAPPSREMVPFRKRRAAPLRMRASQPMRPSYGPGGALGSLQKVWWRQPCAGGRLLRAGARAALCNTSHATRLPEHAPIIRGSVSQRRVSDECATATAKQQQQQQHMEISARCRAQHGLPDISDKRSVPVDFGRLEARCSLGGPHGRLLQPRGAWATSDSGSLCGATPLP